MNVTRGDEKLDEESEITTFLEGYHYEEKWIVLF